MEGEIIERELNQEDQIRIQKFINGSYKQGFLKVRTKNNENFYFCPICHRCYGIWFNNGKGHFHKIHCCDELPQVTLKIGTLYYYVVNNGGIITQKK